MTSIPLAHGVYEREGFPPITLQNLYADESRTNTDRGFDLVARPGQEQIAALGAGGRGWFQKDGVFDGDQIILVDTTLYRVTSSGVATAFSGTVPGFSRVTMDGTNLAGVSTVRIAAGDGLYKVQGTDVSAEAFPDGAGVTSVRELDQFWFALREDTQQIYQLVPGDTIWAALDYTSAEGEPDLAIGLETVGDELWVFGTASVQPFALTGEQDPAIRPIPGRRSNIGCKNRDTICRVGDVVMWVDQSNQVQMAETLPTAVSDATVTEMIEGVTPSSLRSWTFSRDKHKFFVLRVGNAGTWVFDRLTGKPTTFTSKGLPYWLPDMGGDVSGTPFALDTASGTLYRLNRQVLSDDGNEIERIATGYLELREGALPLSSLTVIGEKGVGLPEGQGSDPEVLIRVSRDLRTFGPYRRAKLGAQGRYDVRARVKPGGRITAPGLLVNIYMSDPVFTRITDLRLNAL